MDVTLFSDRLLIREIPEENISPGGIALPEQRTQSKQRRGVVEAVGPGRTEHGVKIPMTVSVGDTVIFSHLSGSTIELNGEEFWLVPEQNLYCSLSAPKAPKPSRPPRVLTEAPANSPVHPPVLPQPSLVATDVQSPDRPRPVRPTTPKHMPPTFTRKLKKPR